VPTDRLGRIGPPVRAIVVAHDPGDWFDETLQSLRDQDYAALSVTVVDVSGDGEAAGGAPTEVAARVAEVMPDATVMVVPGNPGFGPAVNAAARMLIGKDRLGDPGSATGPVQRVPAAAAAVAGTAFLLICHDDVALSPDAVARLVDEAVRRGAGVAGPKLVDWDNSRFLQCVGLSADRMGVPVPLVTAGEYDQGQHDEVAEVLAVPSACLLIRAEVFDRLDGFDGAMTFHGEDWTCAAGRGRTARPCWWCPRRASVTGGVWRSGGGAAITSGSPSGTNSGRCSCAPRLPTSPAKWR